MLHLFAFFFFFQAEDGIRDGHVTGVQTCAVPISGSSWPIDTGVPIPIIAYELCGRGTPIWANTYMTKPEQSKPRGDAPPHTYGVPRYRIAIPTTPPWMLGGATV